MSPYRRAQTVRAKRLEEQLTAPAPDDEAASTPHDGLLRAAENGQYEALVAQARPAQPIAMVTPEEREAELRAAGKWPEDKPRPQAKPKPKPEAEPKEPERELTPNEQYIAEHCQWRRRGPDDYPHTRHNPYRCLVDYDPIALFQRERAERREDEER
jgi:hypothetical protein